MSNKITLALDGMSTRTKLCICAALKELAAKELSQAAGQLLIVEQAGRPIDSYVAAVRTVADANLTCARHASILADMIAATDAVR